MFETMQSFLAFFIPTLALILLGIVFEEKLIVLENGIAAGVKQTIRDWRAEHGRAGRV